MCRTCLVRKGPSEVPSTHTSQSEGTHAGIITHVANTVRTTIGAGLVMVIFSTAGTTAALHCWKVKLKMGSTANQTMPVTNTVQDIGGATHRLAIKTCAVLMTAASQL